MTFVRRYQPTRGPLALFCVVILLFVETSVAQSQLQSEWRTAITFNAALAPNNLIVGYAERRDALAASLRADQVWRDADLVCLQEVVNNSDHQLLASAAAAGAGLAYSYSDVLDTAATASPTTASTPRAACDYRLLLGLVGCGLAAQCTNPSFQPAEVINCLVSSCSPQINSILNTTYGQECVNCMINVPAASILQCSNPAAQPFANYATKFGLLLLSKKPLTNTSSHFFTNSPNLFRRGYLKAEVSHSDTLTVHSVIFFPKLCLILENRFLVRLSSNFQERLLMPSS